MSESSTPRLRAPRPLAALTSLAVAFTTALTSLALTATPSAAASRPLAPRGNPTACRGGRWKPTSATPSCAAR